MPACDESVWVATMSATVFVSDDEGDQNPSAVQEEVVDETSAYHNEDGNERKDENQSIPPATKADAGVDEATALMADAVDETVPLVVKEARAGDVGTKKAPPMESTVPFVLQTQTGDAAMPPVLIYNT